MIDGIIQENWDLFRKHQVYNCSGGVSLTRASILSGDNGHVGRHYELRSGENRTSDGTKGLRKGQETRSSSRHRGKREEAIKMINMPRFTSFPRRATTLPDEVILLLVSTLIGLCYERFINVMCRFLII